MEFTVSTNSVLLIQVVVRTGIPPTLPVKYLLAIRLFYCLPNRVFPKDLYCLVFFYDNFCNISVLDIYSKHQVAPVHETLYLTD